MSPEVNAALVSAVSAQHQATACAGADFTQYAAYAAYGGVRFPGLSVTQIAQACLALCVETAAALYADYLALSEFEGTAPADAEAAFTAAL